MSNHHAHHHRHRMASHAAPSAAFISRAAHPAQISEGRTGVPASVTIAQAILESGWGRHHIHSANNYFGIKAHTINGKIVVGPVAIGYVDSPTTEYVGGKRTHVIANFRSYATMSDSFVDHGLFLRDNARYAQGFQLYKTTGDAAAFATHLQRAGYATDPHYSQMLIKLMKGHNLYQYNQIKTKSGDR